MSSQDKLSQHDKSLFVAHHVGGRGGGVSFPHLPQFSDDILQIIYDADENCIEHIRESFPNSNARVIPYCMAETSGEAHFNINYDPYSSSLYLFNPLFAQSYQWDGSSDYVYGRTFRTQRTVTMASYSIDALVESNEVPAPDFLSIDTQGSELPILRGAINSLATDTIAVCCEINFCELYQGASLFSELDQFLRSCGFLLADITPFRIGYKRLPLPVRGRGIPLQGEALYLMRPETIWANNPANLANRLRKLAFASIAFGYTELAFEALEKAEAHAHSETISARKIETRKYGKFLSDFHREAQVDIEMPPLWHEKHSFEQNTERHIAIGTGIEGTLLERIKRVFKKDARKAVGWALGRVANRWARLYAGVLSRIPIHISFRPPSTKFASFLQRNGFEIAANELRQRRREPY